MRDSGGRSHYPEFALAFFLMLAPTAFASPAPIEIVADMEPMQLVESAEMFRDPTRSLTLEGVMAPEVSGLFKPLVKGKTTIRGTLDAVWIRFTITNRGSEPVESILLYPVALLDNFEVYASTDGGEFVSTIIRGQAAVATRPIEYRRLAVPITTMAGSSALVYVRFYQDVTVKIESSLILIGHGPFESMVKGEHLFLGLFYGIMLAMLLYNLSIYFTIRSRSYLAYCIHIIGITLTWAALNGQAQVYLWSWEISDLYRYYPLLIGWTNFAGIVFTRFFLQTRRRVPNLDKVLKLFMALIVVNTIFVFAGLVETALVITQFLGSAVLIFMVIGFVIWRGGYKPARYYTAAWSFFSIGAALFALNSMGLIETSFLTEWGGHLGSAIEVILLSFALGDRIRTLQAEKEAAELLHRTSLEKLKDGLEIKVVERTSQLQEAKEMAATV